MFKINKSLSYLFGSFICIGLLIFTLSLDENNNSKLSVQSAEAYVEEDCKSFGHQSWNHPASFKNGYDCLCKAREKVKNDC